MKHSKVILSLFIILTLFLETTSQNQQIDRQTEHIQQFARTMSDFVPTQTFTFNISIGQQENFLIWPSADVDRVRGVFYVDNSQDPEAASGEGFFAGCQVNQVMQKTFFNERLGVFNLNLQTKPSNIKFIFKSDSKPLSVYLSYELKKLPQNQTAPQNLNQNVPTKQQEDANAKKSKLEQIIKKFEKVRISVEGQQASLRRVLKLIGRHGRRLQGEIKYAHVRITVESVIVILSGIIGIWIIKRQLNSGYELLV